MGAIECLAECRAVLGGVRDPLRAVWDEQATQRDRRFLLAMSGLPSRELTIYAARSWGDLPNDRRCLIRDGLRRFRAWADRVSP